MGFLKRLFGGHPAPDPTSDEPGGPEAAKRATDAAADEAERERELCSNLMLFFPGRSRFSSDPALSVTQNLPNRVAACLLKWTGARWLISVSGDLGAPTLKEQAQAAEAELRRRAAEHPLVKAVLDAFPGATIDAVRDLKVTEESDADPSESNGEDEAAPFPEEDQ